jgi:gluconolactonase
MFAAPPVLQSKVFAKVTDKLSKAGQKSQWLDVQYGGAPLGSFLEGPSFDKDGNLWVTDIPFGRLFKITPQGEMSVAAEYDG